jgi:transmembrane 9 superfamily member 2/4
MEYYSLPFCHPTDGIQSFHETFGEFLVGDHIQNSPYIIRMKKDMFCEQVCILNLGRVEMKGIRPNKSMRAIRDNYHNNWLVDDLSAASKVEDKYTVQTKYWQGFPIGFVAGKGSNEEKAYINNHVNIEIMYHPVEQEPYKYHVVRVTVQPFSIKHRHNMIVTTEDIDNEGYIPKVAKLDDAIESCRSGANVHTNFEMVKDIPQEASGRVLFTYDVIWIPNMELKWSSRWDIYLMNNHVIPVESHWVAVLNSLVSMFFLSAIVVAILVFSLRRDIKRYEKVLLVEEEVVGEVEHSGWTTVCNHFIYAHFLR